MFSDRVLGQPLEDARPDPAERPRSRPQVTDHIPPLSVGCGPPLLRHHDSLYFFNPGREIDQKTQTFVFFFWQQHGESKPPIYGLSTR
ncbi:hypothetical protein JTE90_022101 [Oedothorax gibbosus]|uniref:Uncharacterized protein n=1 Tax=Oedothorax gibbosus TaxID=931172 RepID=A0AAV6TEW1_9ARAC|nr:hypothetical protein JTE90_022101 [Oedothorax gibbosus]